MTHLLSRLLLALCVLAANAAVTFAAEPVTPTRKIFLLAGDPDGHGPGTHEYLKSAQRLKRWIDGAGLDNVETIVHRQGWPADDAALDEAATLVLISSGSDRVATNHPLLVGDRMRAVEKQMRRGCGLMTFHYSTFAPNSIGPRILEWTGGYFDYESGPAANGWFSKIKHFKVPAQLPSPEHPICRGVRPFEVQEEFYYNIRFREDDPRRAPIVAVRPPDEAQDHVVGWAVEREDGGRGFGFTGGHYYSNWNDANFRQLILNAIVWTAGVEVPTTGVPIAALSAPTEGDIARPIKTLIVTGHQYPGHKWAATTPVIEQALAGSDPRFKIVVTENPEDLAKPDLAEFDVLVMNYCNWQRPGLSPAAQAGLVKYLQSGGGLAIVHFANGAFHFSLPEAGESDWPEWRTNICRRVWDHSPGKSGHDAYGPFRVEIADPAHEITRGMQPFDTTDELYYRQQGTQPIHVLATARSKDLKADAPQAFIHQYGEGRVFQTVLGHDVAALQTAGTAELLRRGATWAASAPQLDAQPSASASSAPSSNPAPPAPAPSKPVGEGRFGAALDARATAATVAEQAGYQKPPLTVECWAKLMSKQNFNVIVANHPKDSAAHWEIYSFAGQGDFSAYLPGYDPATIRSGVDITDGRWRHLAMTFDGQRVQLFVDGERVADQAVKSVKSVKTGGPGGPLWIGGYLPPQIGCEGWIDDVRLSRVVRKIDDLPTAPHALDDDTLGLWRFDELKDGRFLDASALSNPAQLDPPPVKSSAKPAPQGDDHFGEKRLGFRWTEGDSVDNRWNQTRIGQFLACNLPLPDLPTLGKGLCIRVGDRDEATVAFDTASLALRAGWTGGFLQFDPTRFGLINAPRPAGEIAFAGDAQAAWGPTPARYLGLHLHGKRVVLRSVVGGDEVLESPWVETALCGPVFTRDFEIAATDQPRVLHVLKLKGAGSLETLSGVRVAKVVTGSRVTAVALVGEVSAALEVTPEGAITLPLAASDAPRRFRLLIWSGETNLLATFAEAVQAAPAPVALAPFIQPGPARWTAAIETQGRLGDDNAPYTVDTLTLPFDNPYNALFFVGGHDFFPNGDLAVCTVHGDVWRVSGVNDRLQKLVWKRFATGLFQPLGLRVIDGVPYVLGRDQITKLHDQNGDGEADFYENFSSLHETSTGGHDYVTCLETDAEGNFFFVHAKQGLLKLSRDGQKLEVVATGFRNPNGMGLSPEGRVTVAPQEGNWTPASCIIEAQPGGYYGFGGPKITAARPLGYDLPLCYLPRASDNSSGGQVWVTGERWGPLTGHMLHLSYGKCRMALGLREVVDERAQGGTVDWPLEFESGVMRGRFSPHDGQLYVSGLRGWVNAAARDGCLQRVRYTGQTAQMPVGVRALGNGLAISFAAPLDRAAAENPGNYRVQAWNYKYAGSYGSKEYRVSDPRQEGRDDWEVLSATLLDDGRTVFLEIDPLQPAMQVTIDFALPEATFARSLHYTLHAISPERMDPARLTRRARPGQLTKDEQARLVPGLTLNVRRGEASDTRRVRMAALHVPAGASPSSLLGPGAFDASFVGYVQAALQGKYRFSLRGTGAATLQINGQKVLVGAGDLQKLTAVEVALHQGYNRLELAYTPPADGAATVRLDWASEEFDTEPVPPTQLATLGATAELTAHEQLRNGRELFATNRCANCHALPDGVTSAALTQAGWYNDAPSLRQASARLDSAWLAAWLLDPHALRSSARMPALLDRAHPADRQTAADLAAYLTSPQNIDGQAAPTTASPANKESTSASHDDQAERAARLYADLGCINCHTLEADDADEEFGRLSLALAGVKFKLGALAEFLRQPQAHYATTRMPDFRLNAEEAALLAEYLRGAAQPDLLPGLDTSPGDVARGREAFAALNCASCHALGPEQSVAGAKLASVFGATQGCLEPNAASNRQIPDFKLTDDERASLTAFLASDAATLTYHAADEVSLRLVEQLNCRACHARDQENSPRGLIYIEETEIGFAAEALPNLTWAGEKLKPDWTARLLRGETPPARNWLAARMPAFPAYAELLAEGLAAEHGLDRQDHDAPPLDTARAEIGRRLTLKTGLDCRQCHAIGDLQPEGDKDTKLAQGINFAATPHRLRYDFYQRFVLNPTRYDVSTKMPQLAADRRTTKVAHLEDGDARRQFDALWHYLQTVAEPPLAR